MGLLVSAVSFALLSAATATAQLRVRGEVSSSLRAAYDILVRPLAAVSANERGGRLVRNNFESGLFGGISVAQWRTVENSTGVEAAAPVANLGYVMPFAEIEVPVSRYLAGGREQLLRVTSTFLPNGLGRVPGRVGYLYLTPKPGGCNNLFLSGLPLDAPFVAEGPTDVYLQCVDGSQGDGTGRSVFFEVTFPVLVAAIDPAQENRLLRLDAAVVSGKPLTAGDRLRFDGAAITLPILASGRTYQNEPLQADIQEVAAPPGRRLAALLTDPHPPVAGQPDAPNLPYRRITPLPGRHLGSVTVSAQTAYTALLDQIANPTPSHQVAVETYWTSESVRYASAPGTLLPRRVSNDPATTWQDPGQELGFAAVPLDNKGVQYRPLRPHPAQPTIVNSTQRNFALGFNVVGTFDPGRLPGFNPNSQVPLETYYPPRVTAADAATSQALHGRPLTPTANLGDYLAQPPFLLTTIDAARGMTNSKYFAGGNQAAPISVIRVRVRGVSGVDELSLARIRATADAIRQSTGLAVDVTTGSSPQQQTVRLAAGRFGEPALTVHEGWSKLGVATVILRAVDTKSRLLVVLILFVSVFFAASAISATLRARRSEIGVLRCLGWRRRHIFAMVLAEPLAVGFLAGVLGAAASLALIALLGLDVPATQVLLIPPVAVGIALVAGLVPAVIAVRKGPLEAVQPAVTVSRRRTAPPVRRVTGLALRSLSRRPGRFLAAVSALAVGVAALTALVAINLAFQGSVTDTVIGQVVSVRVRSTDYLAVAVIITLGALGVTDILIISVREQAAELTVLRATGWDRRHIAAVTRVQGLLLGVVGAVIGAVLGVFVGHVLGGPVAPLIASGVLAAMVGVVVVTVATIVPAQLTRRLPIAGVLAAE